MSSKNRTIDLKRRFSGNRNSQNVVSKSNYFAGILSNCNMVADLGPKKKSNKMPEKEPGNAVIDVNRFHLYNYQSVKIRKCS